jgi:hypothetical protein
MRRIVPLLLVVAACTSQPAATPTPTDAAIEDTTTTANAGAKTAFSTTTTTSPAVEVSEPVNLAAYGDTVWVVERGGRVVSRDGEVLIDLAIDFGDNPKPESGLLSVEFWEGGYWLYVAWPDTGVSELWHLPYGATSLVGDPLRVWGPAPWHYGGGMEYHEPWLYISIGDGAAGAAHAHEPQKLRPDRGAILRYHARTGQWEPAAIGLRNPWTWTLEDGVFYIGDVGAQDAEEINIAPHAPSNDQGAIPNFGWPVFEGSECVRDGCEDLGYIMPVIEYLNDGPNAVVLGGLLDGELVWTDFFSGVIHYTNSETLETRTLETDYMPTSLLIHNGEVWVASYDGRVEVLEQG